MPIDQGSESNGVIFDDSSGGGAVPDGYGSKTATAGTEITRVIPPAAKKRAKLTSFSYKAAATAHTLYAMPALAKLKVSSDAASGQAVVNFTSLPTNPSDGSAVAAGDWFVVQHETGTWTEYKVSSVSGLAVTFTTNLTAKVKAASAAYFHGAPADHTNGSYTMVASTVMTFVDNCLKAGLLLGSPILIVVDNATNAGTLYQLSYGYTTN